jgi:signal peptidase II
MTRVPGKARSHRQAAAAFIATIAALAVDQFTKAEAFAYVARFGDLELGWFLTITAGTNSGVAFGMATAAHPLLLIGLAGAISVWILILIRNAYGLMRQAALGVILGGALGNIVDRVRFGAVRDTIDLHWEAWHWPTFNLADAFIVTGLLLLVLLPDLTVTEGRRDISGAGFPETGT